jgi:hypothetical protein
MFISVLLTKDKLWKQPSYPAPDEWIKTMYVYVQWNFIQLEDFVIHRYVGGTEKSS